VTTLGKPAVACTGCPVATAAGCSSVQFCPFITREHPAGEVLASAGDAADHVWFVKDGAIGLGLSREDTDQLDAIRVTGSFIGLESLVRDTYLCSARALTRVSLCGATRAGFFDWLRMGDDRVALVLKEAFRDTLLIEAARAGTLIDAGECDEAGG
jgi:CRP-like cAMP-binding protein